MLVVFTVCTLLGGECREITMPLAEEVTTPYGCVRSGQLLVAEWLREHLASHRVEGGYRCVPPARYARAI
ncbi:hypothetical protein [Prosthecomicrobium sp. N25]|uniref:hypothetical protein n=1 Tax=Prosthecomicrobium sp. N25 TaxID=3129254 RepID=UPI003076AC24